MDVADLAQWTPVRIDLSGAAPVVAWADLRQERFDEPFFDQTVARWAAGPRVRPLVRTGLDALVALDREPSLEPAGFVFHLSRCGSTLVSRLLACCPGVVAIAEPSPLNALLGLDARSVDGATMVQLVRLLVRALGRRRHGDERHLVLKCTSWNILRQHFLTAAFPDTPWVWVQRDPAQVIASLLAAPPDWLGEAAPAAQVAVHFGIDPMAAAGMTRAEFTARALGAMLHSATVGPARRVCVDYAELPSAVWNRVAPHLGLSLDADTVEQMTAQAGLYSKSVEPQPFTGDVAEPPPVTGEIRDAARRFAEAGYRRLVANG